MILDALASHNLANRVRVLRNGAEATDYIFHKGQFEDEDICENPSVIILDLNLPKIGGLEILEKIRADEHTKTVPVVIFTSSELEEDIVKSYDLGVNSYIVKPARFDTFAAAVAKIGQYWALLNQPPLC
jgi:two-component system, response regulator